ncbi:RNA-binding protein [Aquipseudomonas ullengensis]|uniref:Uncharacterized protein n=1 Tax=Aquipseudomonas ullengensis TaxID=2759166 RepID=A0A7W4LML4_9GAMM|nr:hypothetical protein [Pseudomonas ullengensis]MBB2495956.1 hypothetical protein [Pseudomonas ullengensis]
MATPFSHPEFQHHPFEDAPLNRDLYLMGEQWMPEYEAAVVGMLKGKAFQTVGYISYASIRRVNPNSLEISWYPNLNDRFHEVSILLPREAFVICVGCPNYDERPHIFVKDSWLSSLHLRPYSAFALIDAIGVRTALRDGSLNSESLMRLRSRIDDIASSATSVSFVSFADSLLLKSNWFVGQYDSNISYSYEPEALIRLFPSIADAFQRELGMEVYAAITQGVNEYNDSSPHHISPSGNHISLNSLGLPFAQLLSIDDAARTAIRAGRHEPKELYIDKKLFHSLHFQHDFDKIAQPKAPYSAPMFSDLDEYYYLDCDTLLSNLQPQK